VGFDLLNAFEQLKVALITTPILIRPDFTKAFILDVTSPLVESVPYVHKKKGGGNESLLMPVKDYVWFKRSFTLWKVSVMHWFGASCISGSISIKTILHSTQTINHWSG
jgi:hypothetical protein